MNNLHRELAPISDLAWTDLEAEATRTFKRHLAGRRVVDVIGLDEQASAAVGTGHLTAVADAADGVQARTRDAKHLVELRVPFTVDRRAVDDVERGARDPDWTPVKAAAKKLAFVEDQAIFQGFEAAGIDGLRQGSSNPSIPLPAEVRQYPDAVAQALAALRLAGVGGPYSLLLSADAYTALGETSDHGYPIRDHVARVMGAEGAIVWAPAISGAFLVSTRGGDHEMYLGQDVSIGYLAHTTTTIDLYFQESFTFVVQTGEASVALTA